MLLSGVMVLIQNHPVHRNPLQMLAAQMSVTMLVQMAEVEEMAAAVMAEG